MESLHHVFSVCISQRGSNPVSANTQKAGCTLSVCMAFHVRICWEPTAVMRRGTRLAAAPCSSLVAAPDSPLSSVCLADQAGHAQIAAAGCHRFSSTGLGNRKNIHFEILIGWFCAVGGWVVVEGVLAKCKLRSSLGLGWVVKFP